MQRYEYFEEMCKILKAMGEDPVKRLDYDLHGLIGSSSSMFAFGEMSKELQNVAQELRLYRQSSGIQKQIERANQELALINMATIQKQQALTVLIDLLNRGVTESQIVQIINFAGEWNKYSQSSTTNGNFQQPVNDSNNPGSSGGGNFSVNDLIRLNLLKSTTTNLLKSARSPPDITSPTIQILSDHHQMRYNSVYQEPV